MGKSFTNEIEERVLSIEERENVRPVDTKQAETLRARARETFLEQLGIVIGENWEIPSAGYIPQDVPYLHGRSGKREQRTCRSAQASGLKPPEIIAS